MAILEVIKYEGGNNILVWKHPAEDFNTSSTLIVHESQEAVFFKNGQIADVFGAGRYVLKTENIPLLRKLMNLPTGGVSTFHCEVYFVNKVEKMSLKWGTDSKVQFIEPNYNFPMEIGASGDMGIQIADSARFLVRLVGAETTLTPEHMVSYFRGILMNRVKSYLARSIKEQQLNIFEIDSQLDVLSDVIKAKLDTDFSEYGVTLTRFMINTVVRPEDDPTYRRLKEAMASRYTDVFTAQTDQQTAIIRQQTEAQKRILMAQAEAEKRRLEGYTYQDERAFDVAEKIASNENTGTFSNMGIGLGMMAGVGTAMGGAVGGMVGGVMGAGGMMPNPGLNPTANVFVTPGQPGAAPGAGATPIQAPASEASGVAAESAPAAGRVCPNCQTSVPAGARFCMGCGQPLAPVCPNCGEEIPSGARFCMHCGQPL
ncbi:MAG: SPFH domain-containing protein [Lachnospiraceae bacterium]|nr:SPFH domain-containing protein [Lachnospiraceae bacterium]